MELLEHQPIEKTCWQKLTFRTRYPRKQYILYASPDLRFLTPVLYDSETEPPAEEQTSIAQQQLFSSGFAVKRRPELDAATFKGPESAKVTIVEFIDFQCPFCAQFSKTLEEVLAEEQSVRLVFRHYPLPFHAWAMKAAIAASCAGEQNRDAFWQMHDLLLSNQRKLTEANLRSQVLGFAQSISELNVDRFATCFDREEPTTAIERDMSIAQENGVSGTPTMFVNGRRIVGVKTPAQMRALITAALGKERTNGKAELVPAELLQNEFTRTKTQWPSNNSCAH
ncbi:MAG TPA: thioredoxin domain-containing protein [Clostridia bacterium]|nr:thioredoxin domain-containing protein [Clostridia bacterium]